MITKYDIEILKQKITSRTAIIVAIISVIGGISTVIIPHLLQAKNAISASMEQPTGSTGPVVCQLEFPNHKEAFHSYPVYKNRPILSNRHYEVAYKEYTIPYQPNSFEAFFENYRYRFFQELLREVSISRLPVEVDLIALEELQKQAFKERQVIHAELDRYFVEAYDSIGYDCNNKQITYKIGLAYEKGRYLTLPEPARRPLITALNSIDSYKLWLQDPTRPFEFQKFIDNLSKNEEFKQDYCNAIQSNKTVISILFPGSKSLVDCNIFFNSGQYMLNPVGLMVIEEAAKHYIDFIRINNGSSYKLICKGYSDKTPIKNKGISYLMGGCFSPNEHAINLRDQVEKQKIAPRISPGPQANLQLSYARAFSGVTQMQHQIELKDQRIADQLSFEYVGYAPGSYSNEDSDRRIEFELNQN